MKTLLILSAAFLVSGCVLLSGEHYVMSYSIEGGTADYSGVTASVTISGR